MWIPGSILAVAIVGFLVWVRLRAKQRQRAMAVEAGRALFSRRREWLEAEFLSIASRLGKPRGLLWADCDFDNPVVFARHPQSGELCAALASVTIRFEAVEGGGMEGVEAVGNLRAATAVFQFDGKKWTTDGRAIFNLSPEETIKRFEQELETVD